MRYVDITFNLMLDYNAAYILHGHEFRTKDMPRIVDCLREEITNFLCEYRFATGIEVLESFEMSQQNFSARIAKGTFTLTEPEQLNNLISFFADRMAPMLKKGAKASDSTVVKYPMIGDYIYFSDIRFKED